MTGRKAEVPAPEQKMVATEVMAATKVGLPMAW
jgi:hypothetical protein